jgi:hypothetical protein
MNTTKGSLSTITQTYKGSIFYGPSGGSGGSKQPSSPSTSQPIVYPTKSEPGAPKTVPISPPEQMPPKFYPPKTVPINPPEQPRPKPPTTPTTPTSPPTIPTWPPMTPPKPQKPPKTPTRPPPPPPSPPPVTQPPVSPYINPKAGNIFTVGGGTSFPVHNVSSPDDEDGLFERFMQSPFPWLLIAAAALLALRARR